MFEMKPRMIALILAAAVVAGLVIFRESRDHKESIRTLRPLRGPAPLFELNDQSNELVKFQRYVGRTRIVLVFFDSELGPDRDPLLRPLLDHHEALERAGIQVVAVSLATPFATRQAAERRGAPFPFPVLTDIAIRDPTPAKVHRMWGRFDNTTDRALTGIFLIDRGGNVEVDSDGIPVPAEDPSAMIARLTEGNWPGP